jgi:hypothetical protein
LSEEPANPLIPHVVIEIDAIFALQKHDIGNGTKDGPVPFFGLAQSILALLRSVTSRPCPTLNLPVLIGITWLTH